MSFTSDAATREPRLVVTIGELLVDFVPGQPGTSVRQAETFRRAAGGAPANVAAAVALLGGRSAFIGRVGADPFGDWLISELATCAVDTSAIVSDPEANTTLAFVSLAGDADRDFIFYRHETADTRLSMADLDSGHLERAAFLHFCSNSLTAEPARSATFAAVERARAAGALISFDVNWRPGLWADPQTGRNHIRRAAGLADILKLSEEELDFVADPDDSDPARTWLEAGARLVLVSLGAAGVRVVTRELNGHVPAARVSAVDTTGAGDALAGALLYELSVLPELPTDPERLLAAVGRANAVAGLSTTRPGAIPSYPDAATLQRFLQASQDPD